MKKLIILLLAAIVVYGCGNPEDEASAKLNEARGLVTEGRFEQAEKAFNEITEKFPKTASAKEAVNELAALRKNLPDEWDAIVKSTLGSFVDLTSEYTQKLGEAPHELRAFDEATPFPEVPGGINLYYIRGVRHGLLYAFAEDGKTTHYYKNGKYQTEESRRTRGLFSSQFVVVEEYKGVRRIMSKQRKAEQDAASSTL